MPKPQITHERLQELLTYDQATGEFRWLVQRPKCVVGARAGCQNKSGYWVIRIDDVLYLAHRLAIFYVTGKWPVGVDHKRGNRESAKLNDLREAGQAKNVCNQKISIRNTSGLKGVSLYKPNGKWRAAIWLGRKFYSLGYYHTKEEAYEAYWAGATRLHGEFANFG